MTYNYTDISLKEFPGEISLILYSGSCSCICPWCFNPELLKYKPLSYKQMKDAIDEHSNFITAVVFSGGEPLLNPFLIKTINYAKSKNLKVKLNTNGLVDERNIKNTFIPFVDYINISVKGNWGDYDKVLKISKVSSIIPRCNTLEYSFVYSPSIHSKILLKEKADFFKKQISPNWFTLFINRWSKPDVFTISQMQNDECLDSNYCDCRVPTRKECLEVAKIFSDIPRKKLIIETKESGRESIPFKKV